MIVSLSPSLESLVIGRHENSFASGVVYHAPSGRAVSSSGTGEIKVWDTNEPNLDFAISTFNFHRSCVWSLDIAGDYVITGSGDHTSKLIDLNIGKCRHTFRAHLDAVNRAIFCPFNKRNSVLTASADKSVSLWDLRSANCMSSIFSHSSALSDVAFPQSSPWLLASCDMGGEVLIHDLRKGTSELEKFSTTKKESVNAVRWLDGRTLAVAGHSSGVGTVVLGSSLEGGIIFGYPDMSSSPVLSLTLLDASTLVASDEHGYISCWS
jgi:WD40 repeat protein